MLPVEATTKVFLSHLHADHIGDIPGLIGSLAKAGRVDPVEIWGGGSEDPALGLAAFVEHMGKAMAWDTASVRGVRPTAGFAMIGHEIPYDRSETVYERNGVTISCFPAIHGLSGAVGYAVGYAGLTVVFSGDTRPCKHVVEAAASADLLIHECFQSPQCTPAPPGFRWRPRSGSPAWRTRSPTRWARYSTWPGLGWERCGTWTSRPASMPSSTRSAPATAGR